MSHALATVLHRGRRPRVTSREARWETGPIEVGSASPDRGRWGGVGGPVLLNPSRENFHGQ